ncbi:putative ribosomal protein L1p/L10e family protein [Colletotrichum karsti]|uniref:Ribosomal protein L1p/L10e family protein n=1 Tax=Colletotrichum karsti TaxID=1095194 RepID=A0A9P6IAV7_9PEZI|nr:putative ribosomal protein L1p/L10e family protein [Colletotrichum karsti]KAF9877176.1 putative ribosomal protein L1p/L10e family protein [Colletotrichum karsti]
MPTVSQTRCASGKSKGNNGGAFSKKTEKKKRKVPKDYTTYKTHYTPQFSLCDAMRYLRAFEVGKPPQAIKYEVHVHLKTPRNGSVVKSRIRLPNPVKSDVRVGVICEEGSPIAQQALQAGAVVAGRESIFEDIRNEKIVFNRLICHVDSEAALNKANLGRILGPKGLMPNRRMKTITDNVISGIRETMGADDYRERMGVIRLAIGQLGFTPKMLAANVKAFVGSIKNDIAQLDTYKEVHEVVLSSSQGPGFSLNGNFEPTDENVKPEHLSTAM